MSVREAGLEPAFVSNLLMQLGVEPSHSSPFTNALKTNLLPLSVTTIPPFPQVGFEPTMKIWTKDKFHLQEVYDNL